MDHPTVDLISKKLRRVEGIIGFPFFARFRTTLDYQAKQLTFVPNGFEPKEILAAIVSEVLSGKEPAARVLAPAALWGMAVDKKSDDASEGIDIRRVVPDSPAARAGLQVGDRLLTLDDRWTDTVNDCYEAAGYVKPGTEVKVLVRRKGKEIELAITPLSGL
jgi:S1-C subfamily serine protease